MNCVHHQELNHAAAAAAAVVSLISLIVVYYHSLIDDANTQLHSYTLYGLLLRLMTTCLSVRFLQLITVKM